MIIFNQKVPFESKPDHIVKLAYHQRVKGRLRIVTDAGLEAGIVSDRGDELLSGEKLTDGNGLVLEISAQLEPVSVATASSALLLARACYHLGNRHTEVQIEATRLLYLRDHVLDSMLSGLGLDVVEQQLPFSPENGAYSGGHSHAHAHSHAVDHGEDHLEQHEH